MSPKVVATKGCETVMVRQNPGRLASGERGSALLMVVAVIALLSLAVTTAVRVVTADQRSLRHDLAREQALATAEAGIEYAIQRTLDTGKSQCTGTNGCTWEMDVSDQGSFIV